MARDKDVASLLTINFIARNNFMSAPTLRYVSSTLIGETLVVTLRVEQIREALVAYALRDELLSLVEATHARNVLFNMEQVEFIGSVGFLAFLAIRRRLAEGRIVLCQMSAPIHQLFAVCRLIPAGPISAAPFEVEDTVDNALARLAA